MVSAPASEVQARATSCTSPRSTASSRACRRVARPVSASPSGRLRRPEWHERPGLDLPRARSRALPKAPLRTWPRLRPDDWSRNRTARDLKAPVSGRPRVVPWAPAGRPPGTRGGRSHRQWRARRIGRAVRREARSALGRRRRRPARWLPGCTPPSGTGPAAFGVKRGARQELDLVERGASRCVRDPVPQFECVLEILLGFSRGAERLRRETCLDPRVERPRHVVGRLPVIGDLGRPGRVGVGGASSAIARAKAAWSRVRSPGRSSPYTASWTRAWRKANRAPAMPSCGTRT